MVDDDRARILRMVADGKISAEEALGLLEALEPRRREEPRFAPPVEQPRGRGSGRALVIRVAEGDESKVNLRLPLGLARAAGKFVPRRTMQSLREHGINLETLLDDVGGVEGTTLVEVHDGNDHVIIAVE
jgi:hypothetical protein